MNLESLMADDCTRVLLNTDDHAQTFTFYAAGSATGTTVSLIMGPSTEAFIVQDRQVDDERRAEAFGSLAALRTAISQQLGAANVRDPARGDRVTRATGAYAGTWYVKRVAADNGDGITLALSNDDAFADAGEGSMRIDD